MMILRHLPNFLTALRLMLIAPFLVNLYQGEYHYAFFVFMTAGVTDGLDGWIARHFNCQSLLGSFLDPVADKLLVTSSFISLALLNVLPWWLVILVFARDFTISLGVVCWYFLIQKTIDFKPTFISKLNTVIQLGLVTLSLFGLAYFQFPESLINTLIILTATTTLISYVDYVMTWGKKAYLQLRSPS